MQVSWQSGFRVGVDESVIHFVRPMREQTPVKLVDSIGFLVGDNLKMAAGSNVVSGLVHRSDRHPCTVLNYQYFLIDKERGSPTYD